MTVVIVKGLEVVNVAHNTAEEILGPEVIVESSEVPITEATELLEVEAVPLSARREVEAEQVE